MVETSLVLLGALTRKRVMGSFTGERESILRKQGYNLRMNNICGEEDMDSNAKGLRSKRKTRTN
jgi:hypothetical protein